MQDNLFSIYEEAFLKKTADSYPSISRSDIVKYLSVDRWHSNYIETVKALLFLCECCLGKLRLYKGIYFYITLSFCLQLPCKSSPAFVRFTDMQA